MKKKCQNLLGTPETRRRGLNTRNALNAFTSNPSICRKDSIVLTTLKYKKYEFSDFLNMTIYFLITEIWTRKIDLRTFFSRVKRVKKYAK